MERRTILQQELHKGENSGKPELLRASQLVSGVEAHSGSTGTCGGDCSPDGTVELPRGTRPGLPVILSVFLCCQVEATGACLAEDPV